MLEIKGSGQSLVVPPDIQMEINLNAPIMNDDLISGSFTMPFKLPFCEINDRFFQNARHIEIRKQRIYENIEIFSRGLRKHFGKLILLRVTNAYEVSFSVVGIALDLLDKSLKDLNYGNPVILGGNTVEVAEEAYAASNQFYPERNFCFPLTYWPNFYNGENPDAVQRANLIDYDHGSKMAHNAATGTVEETESEEYENFYTLEFPPNSTGGISVRSYFLVPCFYIAYILKTIEENFGCLFIGDFINNQEIYSKFFLYGEKALDNEMEEVIVQTEEPFETQNDPMVRVPLTDDFSSGMANPEGYWNTNTKAFTIQNNSKFVIKLDFSISEPSYSIHFTIIAQKGATRFSLISETFDEFTPTNNIYTFNLPDSPGFGSLVGYDLFVVAGNILNNDPITIDWVKIRLTNYYLYKKTIVTEEHMPDIKISELLVSLRQYFNLACFLNIITKEIKIDFVKDIFTKPSQNFTGKRIGKNIEFELVQNDGYTFDHNYGNEKTSIQYQTDKNNFEQVIQGNGKKTIKPEISPVVMINQLTEGVGYCLQPAILTPGYSDVFETDASSATKKLAFFRGSQAGEAENYFFATAHNRLWNDSIEGDYSLQWADPDYGLYVIFWKTWVEFMLANPEKVPMNLNLTEPELNALQLDKRFFEQNSEYIINNIKALYDSKGLKKVQAELLKINPSSNE